VYCVYFIGQNPFLQVLKTTEYHFTKYKLNNDVTITSFCFTEGKGRLHFIEPTVYFPTRWSACTCCKNDSAVACIMLHAAHFPDFIDKDSCPPNSQDMNLLDYRVWGSMLQNFCHLNPQPKDITELKSALVKIWDELPRMQSASRSRISGSVCELV